jgi:hypothetical protein
LLLLRRCENGTWSCCCWETVEMARDLLLFRHCGNCTWSCFFQASQEK